jgi:hypothetical protein
MGQTRGMGIGFFAWGLTYVALVGLVSGCAKAHLTPIQTRQGTEEIPPLVGGMPPSSLLGPIPVPATVERWIPEELEYEVTWWGLPVGTANLKAERVQDGSNPNPSLIHLTLQAKTNWALQAFYPVRVRLESWYDPHRSAPIRFLSYLKRQWRLHESVIAFDPKERVAIHELPGGRRERVPIQPTTQDGLSVLYYARALPMQIGQSIPLEITADGKNWPLTASVAKAEMVQMGELGRWPAVEGQVKLAYPVPFFHGAHARVWLSADENRIPLLARIHSRIGPVTVVLVRRRLGHWEESAVSH